MKKVLLIGSVAFLGVIALSSCRRDYHCVKDGQVIDTCYNCRANGVIKASFDQWCGDAGGTVEKG